MTEFVGYIEHETGRAWLFQDHFWHEPTWLPKSQTTVTRFEGTHEISVSCTNWISVQKKLNEFTEIVKHEGN